MIRVLNENEIIENINDSIIITSSNYEIYYKKKFMYKTNKIYTFNNFIINNYNGLLNIANDKQEFLFMYMAYIKSNKSLKKYNDIDDLAFIKDLLNTYNSIFEYELNDNLKIKDLKIIFEIYEKLLIDNGLLNNKLLLDHVLKNNKFNKNYIFLNINKFDNNKLKLIDKMNKEGSVVLSINKYDQKLIDNLKEIDSTLNINIKENNKTINYYALNDIEEELEFILNDINKKIINESCSYSDILIIAKDKETYEPYFNYIFDFPYSKKEYNGILIKRFIKIFKNILLGDFSCINFINLLKLNLFDINLDLIDKLDNYVYEWNLEDKSFYEDFKFGHNKKLNDELNEMKYSIISTLKCFLENIIDVKNFKDISREFWTYLGEMGIDEKLFLVDKTGYNNLVSISEDICTYFNLDLGIKKYFELLSFLFDKSFNETNYKDEVLISSIDDAFYLDKKYIYLVGASSNTYPKNFNLSGLLNEDDIKKESLISKIEEFISYDKAMFDMIVNLDNVLVTYHKLSSDLSLNEVSKYVNGNKLDIICDIYNKKLILKNYANKLSKGIVKNISSNLEIINKINNSNIHNLDLKISKDNSLKLYTNNIVCSPSSIEAYFKCKFYHFCLYGLKLKVKEKRLFDNRKVGSIIHFILENIVKINLNDMSFDKLYPLASYYAFKYLEDNDILIDNITKYVTDKIVFDTCKVILNIKEEENKSNFKTLYTELRINEDSFIKPISINSTSGKLIVNGIIDRVDVYEDNDKFYYRVIDYKTNGKSFRLDDALIGLNLQMLLYSLAINENIDKLTLKNSVLSGLLYYPASIKEEKIKRNIKIDELDESIKKRLLMQGIINRDKKSLEVMGDNIGDFIDVISRNKINDEKTYNEEEMNLLFNNIKKLLNNMACSLLNGDIKINPVKGRVDSCSFCKFNSICGFDNENDKARYIKNYKNSEVFKMLEGDKS